MFAVYVDKLTLLLIESDNDIITLDAAYLSEGLYLRNISVNLIKFPGWN